jgi:hypothetical protein
MFSEPQITMTRGSIQYLLNKCLRDSLLFVPAMILITFFCKRNTFLLSEGYSGIYHTSWLSGNVRSVLFWRALFLFRNTRELIVKHVALNFCEIHDFYISVTYHFVGQGTLLFFSLYTRILIILAYLLVIYWLVVIIIVTNFLRFDLL